jgi:hypothetical protein
VSVFVLLYSESKQLRCQDLYFCTSKARACAC